MLELKEELQRAEKDLDRLKKQFAMHEANRKMHDVRLGAKTRPLSASFSCLEEGAVENAAPTRTSLEFAHRTTTTGAKHPRRTIMPAQGHTRTLSLLSPGRNPSLPSPRLSRRLTEPEGGMERPASLDPPPASGNSKSTPAIATVIAGAQRDKGLPGIPKDVLIQTGRRMAEDLKDGLWTFLDDLRQATVGDEAVNGPATRTAGANGTTPTPTARKRSSKNSLKGSSAKASPVIGTHRKGSKSPLRQLKDANGQKQEAEITPKMTRVTTDQKLTVPVSPTESRRSSSIGLDSGRSSTFDESWDNWDSPIAGSQSPQWSTSTVISDGHRSPSIDRADSSMNVRDSNVVEECPLAVSLTD